MSELTVLIQKNDLRLVVMAASAFNGGLTPKSDRTPRSTARADGSDPAARCPG